MRALLTLGLAALLALTTAGCSSPKKAIPGSCETSADCQGGVCFAETCYKTCESPAECQPDEYCVPANGTDYTICMTESDFAGCTADDGCPLLVGSPCQRATCDTAAATCHVVNREAGTACATDDGLSGACTDAGQCACTRACEGRTCGDDGCGGVCGLCASGAICMEGQCRGTCVPDGQSDDTCDGKDNDCNGATDDGYVPSETTCGVGACAATGQRLCQGGAEIDTCQPGQGAADDATCNGIDDDCDGATDDDFAIVEVECGAFGCLNLGTTTCIDGVQGTSCTPGTPAADDTVCNGLDDDCDGPSDEDFVPTATACGVGACAAVGQTACLEGVPTDTCTPGTAAADDATCDGSDDDCDGSTDEDFVPTATTCGTGACAASGSATCSAGQLVDTCTPGLPQLDDATCDGIDDDCDGSTDEDFVGGVSTCGVGACASTGERTCLAGAVQDSCAPGVHASSDTTCDGLDDDCEGSTD